MDKKLINATHLALVFNSNVGSNLLSLLSVRGVEVKKKSVNRKQGKNFYTSPIRHVYLEDAVLELEKAIEEFRSRGKQGGMQKSFHVWSSRIGSLKQLLEINSQHQGCIPNTSDEYAKHAKNYQLQSVQERERKKRLKELELHRARQQEFLKKWKKQKHIIFQAKENIKR